MTPVRRLIGSRKAWQIWSGTWANFTAQAVAILTQMSEGLPPRQRDVITLVSVLMGVCFQAAGMTCAVLTALKDYSQARVSLNVEVEKALIGERREND